MKAIDGGAVAKESVLASDVATRNNGFLHYQSLTDEDNMDEPDFINIRSEDYDKPKLIIQESQHPLIGKQQILLKHERTNGISSCVPNGDVIGSLPANGGVPKHLQPLSQDLPQVNPCEVVARGDNKLQQNGASSDCWLTNGRLANDGEGPIVVVVNGLNGDAKSEEDMQISASIDHWDRTVAEVKEQAFARVQEELKKAHQELRLRDEEVNRLSRIREEVEAELEELTASLFQEAHNMVREANVRQAAAERTLKESQMQVEVLTAEVAALKTLVLTSTPSRPNPHLHPQIDLRGNRSKDDTSITGVSLFNRKHRRSPSHFNLKYGRENSPPDSPVKEQRSLPDPLIAETKDGWEVDPNVHKEFVSWKQSPRMDKSDAFIARIYSEDIDLCLDFNNKELGSKVRSAVEAGNIFIEAVSDKAKTVFPKKCALMEAPRQCHYRMKLGDQEQWSCISQICRNRIIAVCEFLNYLRYIERGLVKSSVHDVYWEVTRLRKEMVLARLGLALSS